MGQSQPLNFVPTRPVRDLLIEHREVLETLYDPVNFMKRLYRNCLILQRDHMPKKKSMVEPHDILGLFILLWRRGVKCPHRGLFWRLLWEVRKRNPKNARIFLTGCAVFEHLGPFSRVAMSDASAQLERTDPVVLDRVYRPEEEVA